MKKSNEYINKSVFNVNLKYSRLQNETKELFFKCLEEGRDLEYFKDKLERLWGNLDHKFLEEEINEYAEIIHEYNMNGRVEVKAIPKEDGSILFALVPLSVSLKQEQRFVAIKEREYKSSLNSVAYQNDKDEYLKLKVSKYNNQVVPYELHEYINGKKTDNIIGYRYVQLSTYEAMIHNTNLTRAGWNTTLNDGDRVGIRNYFIPYHSFSCPHCLEHQNKLYTKEDIIDLVGYAGEQEGDILHPNCKCILTFYDNLTQFNKPSYSEEELQEQYDIRQKVNSLTLKREEIKTDIRIQKMLGNQDQVDKLTQRMKKTNTQIKDLQQALPTAELKKQVVAINR